MRALEIRLKRSASHVWTCNLPCMDITMVLRSFRLPFLNNRQLACMTKCICVGLRASAPSHQFFDCRQHTAMGSAIGVHLLMIS